MEMQLKILSESLVSCLDELPNNMNLIDEATSIIQQMIAQLLYKLSLGKVTKVYFDTVSDSTVAVRAAAEELDISTTIPAAQSASQIAGSSISLHTVDQSVHSTGSVKDQQLTETTGDNVSISLSEMEIEAEVDSIPELGGTEPPDVNIIPTVHHTTIQDLTITAQPTVPSPVPTVKLESVRVKKGQLYDCGYCNNKYKDRAKLRRHLLVHTGQRPFPCQRCPESFKQKTHLQDHMKRHTGQKDHKCSDCGRSFSVNRNLIRHRRIHTGERPFSCDLCEASFISSDKLYFHKLKHSGAKPYQCTKCSKSFRRPDYLKVHKCKNNLKNLIKEQASDSDEETTIIIKHERGDLKSCDIEKIQVTKDNKGNKVLVLPKGLSPRLAKPSEITTDVPDVSKTTDAPIVSKSRGTISILTKKRDKTADKLYVKVEGNSRDGGGNNNCDELDDNADENVRNIVENLPEGTADVDIVLVTDKVRKDVTEDGDDTDYKLNTDDSNTEHQGEPVSQSLQTLVDAAHVLQLQNK